jgi:hypothetical protein
MLDDLEKVEWGALEHAYGPASNVPAMLRALVSKDDEEREAALWDLFGTVWHQGTVYSASAPAVPFLIEILRAESTPADRSGILQLLLQLANGCLPYNGDYDKLMEFHRKRWTRESFARKVIEWQRHINAAHDAVCVGFGVYLDLLKHDDADLRLGAAYCLASCRKHALKIVTQMGILWHMEHDPRVKAAMVLAASLLGEGSPHTIRWLEDILFSVEETDIVRMAAGLARIRFGTALTGALFSATFSLMCKDDVFARLWDTYGERGADMAYGTLEKFLTAAGNGYTSLLISMIIKVLDRVEIGLALAETLLDLAFRGEKIPEGAAPDDLTSDQRAVLRAVALSQSAWVVGGNMGTALHRLGINGYPPREALLHFLGLR